MWLLLVWGKEMIMLGGMTLSDRLMTQHVCCACWKNIDWISQFLVSLEFNYPHHVKVSTKIHVLLSVFYLSCGGMRLVYILLIFFFSFLYRPGRKRDFSPLPWSQYFETMEDVEVENENGKDISLSAASVCQEKVQHELLKLWCHPEYSDITRSCQI